MISIGLELEAIYNKDVVTPPVVQNYHHGTYEEEANWKAETDGSLNVLTADRTAYGEHASTFELISKRLVGRDGMLTALNEVKEVFCHNKPLKDCFRFNKTCGAHIHFSILGKVKQRTHIKLFESMRQEFFDRINQSELRPAVKKKIITHYGREYSQMLTKEEYLNPNRRSEFNFLSEASEKGMEWRSVNLHGVNAWTELYTVYNIAYDCIENLERRVRKYNIIENIKLEQNEISSLRKKLNYTERETIKVKL
ncbi:MAG: hypothetical protein D4S01_03165 [Dehalococcoidia bacterium]|nr:MAG: hypothetical protein D4S01_03165 [Dehalococcoidia bacterium]